MVEQYEIRNCLVAMFLKQNNSSRFKCIFTHSVYSEGWGIPKGFDHDKHTEPLRHTPDLDWLVKLF